MKKFLFSMALAFVGWAAVPAVASAATIVIDPNPVAPFSDSAGSDEAVSNAYQFSFAGTGDGLFGALSLGISGLTSAICSDATCSTPALFSGSTSSGPFGLFSLTLGSFSNLAGGTYFLVISGLASGFGGGYIGSLTLNVTPTVPIPGALLLFVTALGGLGAFGHFRRKGSANAAA
jgi:hypothetical protein